MTPAALTVTAGSPSQVYGAALPALTYTDSGLVNGDTASVFSGSLSTSATSGSGVGGYAITQGSLSAGPNYTLSYSPGTLTVTPAALTVTADGLSSIYGATRPALTYTVSGLVNGDTAAVLSGSLTTSCNAGSHVGSYGINQGTLSANLNYALNFNAGILTVTPASLTVTADSTARAFSELNPVFSAGYVGLVNGDTPTSLSGTLGFSTLATDLSPVGSYRLTPGGLTSSDYSITFADGTLTVAPLSLAASGLSIAAVEGAAFSGTVATFASPDSTPRPQLYSATVHWGDGQDSTGVVAFDSFHGVYTVEGINTYRVEGVYAVHVTIRIAGVTVATANSIAVVTDAPLRVIAMVFSPTAGKAYEGTVATFVDANPAWSLSDFSATIDWGDGVSSVGTIALTAGGLSASGIHTFATAGTYRVVITVADLHGSRANAGVDTLVVASTTTPGGGGTRSGTGNTTTTNGGTNSFVGLGVSPAPPPLASSGLVGNSGGTVQIQSRSAVTPVSFRGPIPVATSVGFGSSAAPAPAPAAPGTGTSVTMASGGANSGNAFGTGSAIEAIQGAIEATIESVSNLFVALSRAGATSTVRTEIPTRTGYQTRSALANLTPSSNYLLGQLDELDKQLSSEETPRQIVHVLGTGVIAYAGYVLINSRVGYILLSLLTARPIWGQVDPLAVLLDWEKDKKRKAKSPEDEETLQSMLQENQERERAEENKIHDAPQPGAIEPDGQSTVRRARGRALTRPRSRRTERTPGTL